MMWDRFYECPDVFKMGNWWYLVYSDKSSFMRKVQYFKGRTLDELKASYCQRRLVFGLMTMKASWIAVVFYAGKTASDGTPNRYIWGWCPTRKGKDNTEVGASPAEPEWAGNPVLAA